MLARTVGGSGGSTSGSAGSGGVIHTQRTVTGSGGNITTTTTTTVTSASSSSSGISTQSCPNSVLDPQGWLICQMGNALINLYNDAPNLFSGIFGYITRPVESGLSGIGTTLVQNVEPALESIPANTVGQLAPYFNTLEGSLNNIGSSLSDIPNAITSGFQNIGSYITNGIASGAVTIGTDITKGISAGVSTIGSDISTALQPLINAFNQLFGYLRAGFSDIVGGLSSLNTDLQSIASSILNFAQNAVTFINSFFGNIKTTLINFFQNNIVNPLTGFYQGTILPAVNYVKVNYLNPFINDINTFISDFKSFVGVVSTIGGDIITGVTDVGQFSKSAYNFLVSAPYVLPNWAWITIGGVGAVVGTAVGVVFAKGYFTELGERAVLGNIGNRIAIQHKTGGMA